MADKQTVDHERILQDAVQRHASDVFFIPGEPVSMRVDGSIQRIGASALQAAQVRAVAEATIGESDLEELGREAGEVTRTCRLPGGVGAQFTVARCRGEYTVVARLLPQVVPTLEQIGVPQALVQAAESLRGLVVIAGPTGSGKSTVANSILNHLSMTRPVHICTVEDPLALCFTPKTALVQQREVGVDVPDGAAGVRAAVRQDADVVFIDTLRWPDELQEALEAAMTGRLVVTVAHAASPAEVIQGLVDIERPERETAVRRMLARALTAVSVQCLLPKADGPGRVAAYGVLRRSDEVCRAIVAREALPYRMEDASSCPSCLADSIRRLQEGGVVTAEVADAALKQLQ